MIKTPVTPPTTIVVQSILPQIHIRKQNQKPYSRHARYAKHQYSSFLYQNQLPTPITPINFPIISVDGVLKNYRLGTQTASKR
jgi:hypothetical protein